MPWTLLTKRKFLEQRDSSNLCKLCGDLCIGRCGDSVTKRHFLECECDIHNCICFVGRKLVYSSETLVVLEVGQWLFLINTYFTCGRTRCKFFVFEPTFIFSFSDKISEVVCDSSTLCQTPFKKHDLRVPYSVAPGHPSPLSMVFWLFSAIPIILFHSKLSSCNFRLKLHQGRAVNLCLTAVLRLTRKNWVFWKV